MAVSTANLKSLVWHRMYCWQISSEGLLWTLEKQNRTKLFCPPCWWLFLSEWPRHMPQTHQSVKVSPECPAPLLLCQLSGGPSPAMLMPQLFMRQNHFWALDDNQVNAYLKLTLCQSPKRSVDVYQLSYHHGTLGDCYCHSYRAVTIWGRFYYYSHSTDGGTVTLTIL